MLSPEETNIIERINAKFGTKHRSKPYDYSNPDDLQEMLLISVSAYRDYTHYERKLINVLEFFDESLEYFDTLSWFNLGIAPDKVEDYSYSAVKNLHGAIDAFDELGSRAKATCILVLKTILNSSKEVQKKVWKRYYKLSPHEMDGKINELFDIMDETEYKYAMPDNLATLLETMKSLWS